MRGSVHTPTGTVAGGVEEERGRISSRLRSQWGLIQGSISPPWGHDPSWNQESAAQPTEPPGCPTMPKNLDPLMLYNGYLITLKSGKHFFCVFIKIIDLRRVYEDTVKGTNLRDATWKCSPDPHWSGKHNDNIVEGDVVPFSLYFFMKLRPPTFQRT